MSIMLLFGLFPKEHKELISKQSRGLIQYAADALQWSFVQGITHFSKEVSLTNLQYIGSYPKLYNKFRIPGFRFNICSTECDNRGENVSFINLFLYRNLSRYLNAKRSLLKWGKHTAGKKTIIIYAVHTPFIKAAVEVKKELPEIDICLIVPDLPKFMSSNNNIFVRILKSYNEYQLSKLYKHIDKYVLLTENMKDMFPIVNNKFTVVEGIYSENSNVNVPINQKCKIKTIFYGGTLAESYGVLNLVKAFCNLQNKDYRLVICGDGDSRNKILRISAKDKRIIFKGQLPREEVLKQIQEASLLVNPRNPEGEFTKYSFPSKTMEYLGSGIPTLIYRLEGIPEEYFHHCFTLKDNSIEALSNKIEEILSMDSKILEKMGVDARNFILLKKNPVEQCKKVMKLIEA